MIDVTGTDVAPGDEVVIVGEQGSEGDRRARDGRVDRHDSVRAPLPRRQHGLSGFMADSSDAQLPMLDDAMAEPLRSCADSTTVSTIGSSSQPDASTVDIETSDGIGH